MKLFNANAFITSLMTLAAIAIPATSNAQFAPHDCSTSQNTEYQIETDFSPTSTTSCIQNAVDTIYNPNSTWQPNL